MEATPSTLQQARVRNALVSLTDSESDSESASAPHKPGIRSRSGRRTSACWSTAAVASSRSSNTTTAASSPSVSSGCATSMSRIASWVADRAAALVGLARPSMDRTNSANDEHAQRSIVATRQSLNSTASSGWLDVPRWLWIPTSARALEEAEAQCLRKLKSRVHREMVHTDDGYTISTVTVQPSTVLEPDSMHPPVVLLHGFAGGAGIWCLNLDDLATDRTVYAIDMIGFGRSSRPTFSTDPAEAEALFVSSFESWRRAMSLTSFVLVGHSLGGFVASSYALKHPGRIEHMILADCWGMPERPENRDEHLVKLPPWVVLLGKVAHMFSPLAGMRLIGPFGAICLRTLRPDLKKKFAEMFDDDTIPNYIYHLNAQSPSGEMAMNHMSAPFGWAKRPMLSRLVEHLDVDMPVTLLYGQRSWVDCKSGYALKTSRPDSYVDVRIVERAGHHVYSDRAAAFNDAVRAICARVSQHLSSSAEDDDSDN